MYSSVFEIGSITKVFTTSVLALMAATGDVSLDDPVTKFLPSTVTFPESGRPITLADIATQSSGLPRLPTNFSPADPSNPYADYSVDQMYEFLGGVRLTRAPGDSYEYSNLAMGLLGHVLALRAGTTYEAMVTDRLLVPILPPNCGTADPGLPPAGRRSPCHRTRDGGETGPMPETGCSPGPGAGRSSIAGSPTR